MSELDSLDEQADEWARKHPELKEVCNLGQDHVDEFPINDADSPEQDWLNCTPYTANPYYTPKGGNKMKVDGLTRSHQTLAVYDFTNSTPNYANSRSVRLNQSLNGDNIKADEVSINGSNAVKGYSPSVDRGPGKIRVKDIEAFAAEKGYNHVVISRPVGNADLSF